jgi:hypothetical protein
MVTLGVRHMAIYDAMTLYDANCPLVPRETKYLPIKGQTAS